MLLIWQRRHKPKITIAEEKPNRKTPGHAPQQTDLGSYFPLASVPQRYLVSDSTNNAQSAHCVFHLHLGFLVQAAKRR